jgi:hypothetical protein
MWGEIDLVRTDVFVPALAGLFPPYPVSPGDRWQPDEVAISELTDLEKITRTDLECRFDKVTTLLGRRTAHVSFAGKVDGIGEDGSTTHELKGSFYVDLGANFLSYLYVRGTHHLLAKGGGAAGKIEGTFVLTRDQTPKSAQLSNDALRGLALEPSDDNTQLLYEEPKVGVRVLYPRNWRIAGTNDKQIGIDENRGSGLLLTLSPAASTPTVTQFRQETLNWLQKEKGKLVREEKARQLEAGLESFLFEVELGKDRVVLQYFVFRQGKFGATMAVRMNPAELRDVQPDVERIARSVRLTAPR